MGRRAGFWMLCAALWWGGAADSSALGLGNKLQAFSLADQHGNYHRVDENVRVIILTRDMASSDTIRMALEQNGKSLLQKHHAVYVVDVSLMPAFVTKLVAMPKLRARPYPTLLDMSGDLSDKLPSKEKHATLIFLDKLQITAVEYLTNPEALPRALEAPKRFAAQSAAPQSSKSSSR